MHYETEPDSSCDAPVLETPDVMTGADPAAARIAVPGSAILLADDDHDDQLLMGDALRESGIERPLICVDDGVQLLDYLHRRGRYADVERYPMPGLILLDLNMPRIDGRDALRQIRAMRSFCGIPILVFSTSQAPDDIHSAYRAGANSYLRKPAEFSELVHMMRTLTDYWFGCVRLPRAATPGAR
jgi:CheY-like chemotaxis protein